jgi:hypothetical protein
MIPCYARDDVLTAARAGAPPTRELPSVPDFHSAPDDLVDPFTTALARLDGKVIAQPPAGSVQRSPR